MNVQICNFNAECLGECIFDYMDGSWQHSEIDSRAADELFKRFHHVNGDNIIIDCLEKKSVLLRLLVMFFEGSDMKTIKKRVNSGRIDFEGIADYIRRNVNSKDVMTVEHLAQMAHVHYNYFITGFHQYFGVSPMQYIIDERIRSAKELLEKKPMSRIISLRKWDVIRTMPRAILITMRP